jgi:aconitate hydratase
MEPRHLGVKALLTRSFARIHETNLKKQGMLALTFANPHDYNLIQEHDRIDILGLIHFTPGIPLKLVFHHQDGSSHEILAKHTYNDQQIKWFQSGSCLNYIKQGN